MNGGGTILPYETRRWPRHNVDVPVRLIIQGKTEFAALQARGKGLNRGGMALLAGVELDNAERVAVEFMTPYTLQPIKLKSLVRSRSGYRYGIEFIAEDSTDIDNVCQLESVLKTLD